MKRGANKYIVYCGIFFLFLFISYGITSYSSTLTHSTVCESLDAYEYRYIGMVIAKGGMPYMDAFDNKGPVLHILNFLGYLISKKYGVFFVEFIFMVLYLCVQYAIARRFTDIRRSLIYTVAAAGPIGAFFVGNMTEEYALFFISLGILIFIDYFLFSKKNWYRILICGAACGMVLMIRPNMIAVWAVFCIFAVIVSIRKDRIFPVKTAVFFGIGVLSVIIPILIWLSVNGALEEFWNYYFIYNFRYSGDRNSLLNIYRSMVSFVFPSLSEIYILLLLIMIIKKENVGFNIAYLLFMLLNLLSISISGKGFAHYGMTVLPTLIYPLSASSKIIKGYLKNKSYLFELTAVLSSVILIGFIFHNYYFSIRALAAGNPENNPLNASIVSLIKDNTKPDETILVFGYQDYYYVESDRLASSKFHAFVPQNDDFIYGGLNAVIEDINKNPPKMVIIVEGFDCDYLQFDFDSYYPIDDDMNVWLRVEI